MTILSRKLWETIEWSTMFQRIICLASLLLLPASGVFAQTETVVVRPIASEELLVNPGMGITTFQRFNGQELNAGLGWSEDGPTTKLSDAASSPDFPDSSIAYCTWFWS